MRSIGSSRDLGEGIPCAWPDVVEFESCAPGVVEASVARGLLELIQDAEQRPGADEQRIIAASVGGLGGELDLPLVEVNAAADRLPRSEW